MGCQDNDTVEVVFTYIAVWSVSSANGHWPCFFLEDIVAPEAIVLHSIFLSPTKEGSYQLHKILLHWERNCGCENVLQGASPYMLPTTTFKRCGGLQGHIFCQYF